MNSPTFSESFEEDAIAMTNIETLSLQYYDNNGGIYDDGIKLKDILLVLILIYSLLNKANHVKEEAHMAPPSPHITLNFPTNTQSMQYRIIKCNGIYSKIHAYKKLTKQKLININEIMSL